MAYFVINGGKKLKGTIATGGSKNAVLPCMAACLLSTQKSTLTNVPRIEEVNRFLEVFTSMNVRTRWVDEQTLEIDPSHGLRFDNIDYEAAVRTRVILFLIGVGIHFFKEFKVPCSSGCNLGSRTVRPHLLALQGLGVTSITATKKYYQVKVSKLHGADIVMLEAGDTATSNAILGAVLTPGTTTISFASCNYMVQELCICLQRMGAKIEGIGSSTLRITGVKSLRGLKKYPIMPDPIESMTLLTCAVVTKSSITVTQCPYDFLALELLRLKTMGWKYKIVKKYKSANGFFTLVDIQTLPSTLTASPDKIAAQPYPGINFDNLPYFALIATQAKGQTLIHDWGYENRAIYYMELERLGATMHLADPHRVFVEGPSTLKPADITAPQALRPSVILLLGMLAAKGKSVLRNIYHIERGYSHLAERLQSIGADIHRVEE